MAAALLYVAAELGIADLLSRGPQRSEQLARQLGVNPGALYRALRGMVALRLLDEQSNGAFALTPRGEHLRSGRADTLRGDIIRQYESNRAWYDLLHTIRTGETAFDHLYGEGLFARMNRDPDVSGAFARFFADGPSHIAPEQMRAMYDFSPYRTVVDVGGGSGVLLAVILRAYPLIRGILFDLAAVVAEAGSVSEGYHAPQHPTVPSA